MRGCSCDGGSAIDLYLSVNPVSQIDSESKKIVRALKNDMNWKNETQS